MSGPWGQGGGVAIPLSRIKPTLVNTSTATRFILKITPFNVIVDVASHTINRQMLRKKKNVFFGLMEN